MKKLSLLFLTFICLCTICANTSNADCYKKQIPFLNKICQKPCNSSCPQPCDNICTEDGFLCTKTNLNSLVKCINLSNAQVCNAHKIQEKYEQEVLSFNDRIQCEKQKLSAMENECTKNSKIRKQKRYIKNLERDKKKICDCYEKQFKATLSKDQIRKYNKAKKGR